MQTNSVADLMKTTLRSFVGVLLMLGSPALANPSHYPILPYSPNKATGA